MSIEENISRVETYVILYLDFLMQISNSSFLVERLI